MPYAYCKYCAKIVRIELGIFSKCYMTSTYYFISHPDHSFFSIGDTYDKWRFDVEEPPQYYFSIIGYNIKTQNDTIKNPIKKRRIIP
jgi:hypothetical protein